MITGLTNRQVSGRELDDRAVRFQAEAFLAYYRRAGLPLLQALERWARGKDFAGEDLDAIRTEVLEP